MTPTKPLDLDALEAEARGLEKSMHNTDTIMVIRTGEVLTLIAAARQLDVVNAERDNFALNELYRNHPSRRK